VLYPPFLSPFQGQRGNGRDNMTLIFNKHKQRETRRYLRKNSTAPERMLWLHLKNKQLRARFRRQYGIGHYIADFCSPRQKLVIEIEGGIHDNEEEKYYDQGRRLNIEDLGFRVLYFTNEEIEQEINKVIEVIKKHIK